MALTIVCTFSVASLRTRRMGGGACVLLIFRKVRNRILIRALVTAVEFNHAVAGRSLQTLLLVPPRVLVVMWWTLMMVTRTTSRVMVATERLSGWCAG